MPKTFKWRKEYTGFTLELFRDKVYERVKSPQMGDVVVDAGAHVGLFTVKASLQVGKQGKVYAFEPEPENFSLLRENTKGLKNVKIFQKALWSSEKDLTLFIRRDHIGAHSLIDWVDAKYIKERLPLRTTFLDKIVKGKVNFIKMDVEGAELEALKGAVGILKQHKPLIAVELHNKKLVDQVTPFLLTYGYQNNTKGNLAYELGVHTFTFHKIKD